MQPERSGNAIAYISIIAILAGAVLAAIVTGFVKW